MLLQGGLGYYRDMPMSSIVIKEKVNRQAVNQLYEHYLAVLNGESVGTAIFVIILWHGISHTPLLIWLALNIISNGLARLLTYSYHQRKRQGKIKRIGPWKKLFVISVFLGGTIWGLAGILFYFVSDDLRRIIIIIMLTAIVGSANGELFPSKISYAAFVIPIYIAMLVLAFSQDILIYNAIFAGVLLFIIFTGLSAYTSSNALENSLRLQYINKELIHELSNAKHQLEKTNDKLQKEIKIRYEAEKTLSKLARHDHLTGLPNRILLHEKLSDSLRNAKQNDKLIALLFVDLDNFKKTNDSLGHDIGDKLLIEASNRLKKIVRKKDLISRVGGDEFCVVVDNLDDISASEMVAKKICHELSKPFLVQDHEIMISTSIGISIYPYDSKDIKTLFKNADMALYKVKNSGRNSYQYFTEKMK